MDLMIEVGEDMVNCALCDPNWCVIDTRDPDTYIGWSRDASVKGGHILHAALFSAVWLDPVWGDHDEDFSAKLDLQLEAQGITPDKKLIVYDENGRDALQVLHYLREKGFGFLFYFDLNQWSSDMLRYPQYRLLAPTWWVKDLIDGKMPQHYDGNGYKIFEISWKQPSRQYLAAHIPGAVHIDSNEFEKPPEWIRYSDEQLIRFASDNGITPDTTVVIYANNELGAPAKLSAVLRYMGVKNVLCLNGTLLNWVAAGYPTESGCEAKRPCSNDPSDFQFDRTQIVDIDEVKAILAHPLLGTVVDTRGWKQYIGEDSGYDYVPLAGRIPKTKWCWYPQHYASPNNTMGNAEVMLRYWENSGINLRNRMVFFCGSASWGAAISKLYGNAAGYANATIFEGGWCQWQNDPANPYETGIPEEWKNYDPNRFHVSFAHKKAGCHQLFDEMVTLI